MGQDGARRRPRWAASDNAWPEGADVRHWTIRTRTLRATIEDASPERRHHLLGDALELLEHDGLGRAHAGRQVDVLHAGIARLELFQVLDQLLRRAGEPGAELHVVVE